MRFRTLITTILIALFASSAQADRLVQNTTPAERARGCVFSEDFRSEAEVEANGCSAIAGTPDFSPVTGVTIQPLVDELVYDINPSLFLADPISIRIDFTPAENYDTDAIRYLFDTPGTTAHVLKTNDAGNHGLEIRIGGSMNAVIAEGVYGPYWLANQRNVLVISATDGASKAWLNGTEIMDDATAWEADVETSLMFGINFSDAYSYNGELSKFQIYHSLLTAEEAQDFYDHSTYQWENQATAHYQMRLEDHDATDVELTTQGNANPLLGTIGTMESWQGTAVGSCTDCPTGLTCDCSLGGDVNPSAVQTYNGSTSAALDPGGIFYSIFYMVHTLEAGKAYQVSLYYYGADGTEDATLLAGNTTLTETYNFATDAWTAPSTGLTITDAPAAWTRLDATIITGATTKTGYAVGVAMTSGNGSALYVDGMEIRELTNPLELVHAPAKQTSHGYDFDGANDYLTGAIETSVFNNVPLSAVVEFTPHFECDDPGDQWIFNASDGFGSASAEFKFYHYGTSNRFDVTWSETYIGNTTEATVCPHWRTNQRNVLIISSTSGDTDVYLNGALIMDSDNTAWSAAADTDNLVLAAENDGGNKFDGVIHSFVVVPLLFTELQALDIDHTIRARGNDQ